MLGTPASGHQWPFRWDEGLGRGRFYQAGTSSSTDATIHEQKQPPPPRNEMREGEAFISATLSPCPGKLFPTLVKRNDF